jgi:hypothetical protein
VANAPTRRRPPNYPSGRRSQRGPRLVAGSIRDRLTSAVVQLKNAAKQDLEAAEHAAVGGDDQSAQRLESQAEEKRDAALAVEAVLSPHGYLLLRRDTREEASPLAITTNEDLRQTLKDTAEEFGVVLSSLAEEAYLKVRDGWVPPRPLLNRGTGSKRAVLNVRVDSALRSEVREMLPAVSERAGFKVAEGNLVLSYICEELGVERPGTPFGERMPIRVPRVLLEHWKKQAGAQGTTVQQVAEEGIRDLLDGSWDPSVLNERTRGARSGSGQWSEADRQSFFMSNDPELFAALRAKAEELSKEFGFLVYPGVLVRALLTERLGQPE